MLLPQHLDKLPIFPLPKVSLFPDAILPLHVFEPRYRELTRYCIKHDWPMAVPMLKEEQSKPDSQPEVHAIAGVGRITHHQELPDGRFGIILEGCGRVQILEELVTDLSYRLVRVELLPDIHEDATSLESDMQVIRDCISLLRVRVPNLVEALTSLTGDLTATQMANRLGAMFFRDPSQRQRLLAEQRVDTRLRLVRDRLAALAARTASSDDAIN